MDIGKFLTEYTLPILLGIALIGAVWIVILGFRIFRAKDVNSLLECKKRLVNVALGTLMTIIFFFAVFFIVRSISDAIYWP